MIPTVRTFQVLVVVNWLAFMAIDFVPMAFFTSNDRILELIALDGVGSALGSGMTQAVFWANVLLASIAALGMLFFQGWARTLFLVLLVANQVGTLFFGVRVSHPTQAFAGGIMGMTDGMTILLAYLQPLSKYFEQRDAGTEPPPPDPDEVILR
ncbi:hypothetical protein DSM104443_01082 [Usitatibacter rugosus]|uniref:DUF4345 domain-containing protein n=1 Tax=Usitatibacter rugosus TaxID=2732067 RepID=A0A6M4GS04_9PROT|nr:hypothetical protein [Usitatibacter rugosus]QJR10031.1 hypothetical protein DSM104443_01082 [Usitatibacter rugosus]